MKALWGRPGAKVINLCLSQLCASAGSATKSTVARNRRFDDVELFGKSPLIPSLPEEIEALGRPLTSPAVRRRSLLRLSSWLSRRAKLAGMDGNRTHPGRVIGAPQTVLKTAGGTSRRSSPRNRRPRRRGGLGAWRILPRNMDAEAAPREDWARTRRMRRLRAALQTGLMFPALSSFCRLTVRDRDLLRSLNGPAVFVSNHVSASTPWSWPRRSRRGTAIDR